MTIFKYLKSARFVLLIIIGLTVVRASCELSLPAYTSDIVDTGIMRGGVKDESQRAAYIAAGADMAKVQMDYMLGTGAKMLGITLLSITGSILVSLLASYSAAKISRDLRNRIYRKILSFSNAEIDHFTTASLITRSTNDIQQIQMALTMSMRIVLFAPIMGIGGVIRAAGARTGMGWIIGLAAALVMSLVITLMRITMPKFKILQTLVDRLNLVSREILTGLPVIRAFCREKHEEERFNRANTELMKTQLFTGRTMSLMQPVMGIIMNGVTVMIVWFGSRAVDMGTLEVGGMMAFIGYTMHVVFAFMMISMISIMLPRANVAAERVEEVLNTTPSIVDPPAEQAVETGNTVSGDKILRFEDVSFRFPGAAEDVLKHISFTARPGETTAIIGGTGSGKSALVNLIPRLYDIREGKISIGGLDIRTMSQARLRSLMGFVPQRAILFSGDIASNLKFGGQDISDEAMQEAAETAQAVDFIGQKDGGYQSSIAQGGGNVSGGQKQRLSIARAIVKKPRLLIFDDSFSALDFKTDLSLRRALGEKLKDTAMIIVAQRISTVLHAQQIIVLNQGEIAGIGTHAELMKNCAAYIEIARSQLSDEELGLKEAV